jgi:hypothetical protein
MHLRQPNHSGALGLVARACPGHGLTAMARAHRRRSSRPLTAAPGPPIRPDRSARGMRGAGAVKRG